MADVDAPAARSSHRYGPDSRSNERSWNQGSDTAPYYDNQRYQGVASRHGRGAHSGRGSGSGRRAKGYRRLWEHVKTVGRGDAIDVDKLYVRCTTAQGAAATADVFIYGYDLTFLS